jgi:hypothetical protein
MKDSAMDRSDSAIAGGTIRIVEGAA